MLFSCYNITKCTLTTDRQIATTRARMVHGQTVHIWWNEWKASCLLLPPHFPYRNHFRRSFSFVLFPQENVEKFSVKKKQTAVAWSIRVEQVRHLVFVWEWRKTPHRCCWMGKAFSPSTTPVYRFIHRCFSTNSCLFLFVFLRVERRARGTCSVGHRRLREAKAVGSVIDRLHRLCEHRQHVLADVYANGANTNSIPRKTTLWANYGRLITFRSCCR